MSQLSSLLLTSKLLHITSIIYEIIDACFTLRKPTTALIFSQIASDLGIKSHEIYRIATTLQTYASDLGPLFQLTRHNATTLQLLTHLLHIASACFILSRDVDELRHLTVHSTVVNASAKTIAALENSNKALTTVGDCYKIVKLIPINENLI